MGLRLLGNSGSYHGDCPTTRPADPNPAVFKIRELKQIGAFVLAVVNYPNCTEYDGDKILIYDFDVSIADIGSEELLDPHFIQPRRGVAAGVYPIARFVANARGRMLAECFCENCPEEVED